MRAEEQIASAPKVMGEKGMRSWRQRRRDAAASRRAARAADDFREHKVVRLMTTVDWEPPLPTKSFSEQMVETAFDAIIDYQHSETSDVESVQELGRPPASTPFSTQSLSSLSILDVSQRDDQQLRQREQHMEQHLQRQEWLQRRKAREERIHGGGMPVYSSPRYTPPKVPSYAVVVEKPAVEEEPVVEVIIPVAVRPFLNKDINFDLFLEMLTEKVDA